ncbi:YjhX family toxin [Sandarakinorhabdus oryzae]|uniref:YjhX family toxin n=1 Tax=Sandarakinorhabdus oryzae TaxID=2675220 RepID=UPI0012E13F2B|nr:YjhX family toxin [Sandarakinorhabdus oryzae]
MDISRSEQRILHLLAQGGSIHHRREDGHIVDVLCFTRDGACFAGLSLSLFKRLKRRGYVESRGGAPYRISRLGLARVRSQLDNR